MQSPLSQNEGESEYDPQHRMQTEQDTVMTVDQDDDVAEECCESGFIYQES